MEQERQNKQAKQSSFYFNLAIIFFIILFAGIGLVYYLENAKQKIIPLPSLSDIEPKISKIIAGQEIKIPKNWIRYSDEKQPGIAKEIELYFILPITKNENSNIIRLIIQPKELAPPSAQLLDNVYLHQFLAKEDKSIAGLIGKPLKQNTGFIDEIVYYDAINPNPFVAKCMRSLNTSSSKPCIRTVQISPQLSISYKFDFEILNHWRLFDKEAQKWLDEIEGL